MYRSEIITIGDEVLLGQTVNGNAAFIGSALAEVGIPPSWTTVVGDLHEEIKSALQVACARADVVIVTGGLGPTPDDLTQAAVADYFGLERQEDPELLEHVKALFASRGVAMPGQSRNQAVFPIGAHKIPNEHGTATGIHIVQSGTHVFVLPGVPQEAQAMMTRSVLPVLADTYPDAVFLTKTLRLAGIGESLLMQKLGDLAEIQTAVGLAFLPSHGLLDLRLNALSHEPELAETQIAQAESLIRARAGEHIYGTGTIPLAQMIGNILLNRSQKLATAESCTGGLIASTFTDIAGASRWFERGWITYSDHSKLEELGVGALRITKEGAVSESVAQAMAVGAMKHGGAEWGLATTGIAGPEGGTPDKPVGTVWIAVASAETAAAKLCHFPDSRELFKLRTRNAAMFFLYKKLMEK
jgi:nicotinamide-nucleotide amidase